MLAVLSSRNRFGAFPLFLYGDLALLVFELCDLTSLVALAGCGKKQRTLVWRFLLSRTRVFLSAFLDHEQQHSLFECMRLHGGAITGSVACSIFMIDTLLSLRDMPRDLNITIPASGRNGWTTLMQYFAPGVEGQDQEIRLGYIGGLGRVTVYSVPNTKVSPQTTAIPV